MDLSLFAAEVGSDGLVTIEGQGSRGGGVPDVRTVRAPAAIDWIEPEEMTVCCGAGTAVAELDAALAAHGQRVAVPDTGTVGGALAVGRSGIRRLGDGPLRDVLLQARYVSARGDIVKAGGPTVKNVSGFDLCRLLVGSRGTLGFIGDVILRTRPRPRFGQWYKTSADPQSVAASLYRPTALLWDGSTSWALLEGDPRDVDEQVATAGLMAADGPPALPTGGRWSIPPSEIAALAGSGRFVVEVGVGIVHHERPPPPRPIDPAVAELHRRIKARFDPDDRLNPGVDPLRDGG